MVRRQSAVAQRKAARSQRSGLGRLTCRYAPWYHFWCTKTTVAHTQPCCTMIRLCIRLSRGKKLDFGTAVWNTMQTRRPRTRDAAVPASSACRPSLELSTPRISQSSIFSCEICELHEYLWDTGDAGVTKLLIHTKRDHLPGCGCGGGDL
jgi:hypothetical protein